MDKSKMFLEKIQYCPHQETCKHYKNAGFEILTDAIQIEVNHVNGPQTIYSCRALQKLNLKHTVDTAVPYPEMDVDCSYLAFMAIVSRIGQLVNEPSKEPV